jgi:hypothetical protein
MIRFCLATNAKSEPSSIMNFCNEFNIQLSKSLSLYVSFNPKKSNRYGSLNTNSVLETTLCVACFFRSCFISAFGFF